MSYSNTPKSSNKTGSYDDSKTSAPQPPPQSQAPIPKTIFIDCNRSNAASTTNGMNPDTNHSWTCEFPSIQLRAGDEVKVSSAYLNSIGVADLINWTRSGLDQDNKARWIMEYYGQNDAKNNKREGYNMVEGEGNFPYPVDNKAAQLCRFTKMLSTQTARNANDACCYTWFEDPYIGGRFHGLVIDVPCVEVENSFFIEFVTNVQTSDQSFLNQKVMLMRVRQFINNIGDAENLQAVNTTDLFGCGQVFTIQSQSDPKADGGNRNTYNHGRYNYKFMCYGIYRNYDGGGENYVMLEAPYGFDWTGETDRGGLSLPNTCKFLVTNGNSYMVGTNHQGIPANQDMRVCNFNRLEQFNIPKASASNPSDYYLYYGLTATQSTTSGNADVNCITNFLDQTHTKQSWNDLGYTSPYIKVALLGDDTNDYLLYFEVLSLNSGTGVTTDESNIQVRFTALGGVGVDFGTDAAAAVNQLFAYNGNTMNFTFNIDSPNGYETAVCYAGNYQPFTTSGLHHVTYDGANAFTFSKVIRNLSQISTLYQLNNVNINKVPVNVGNNYVLLNGFDYTQKLKIPEEGRLALSSTYANNLRAAPAANNLPIFHLVKTNLTSPFDVTDAIMELPINDSIKYGGWDRDSPTDHGMGTPLGRMVVSTNKITPSLAYTDSRLIGIPSCMIMDTINRSEYAEINTTEVIHYDFFDFQINEHYSSPSDVATELTQQTHNLTNARYNKGEQEGVEIDSTLGAGIAQNKFLIPVYSTAEDDNTENDAAGTTKLNGLHVSGSYVLKKYIYKLPQSRAIPGNFLTNGNYYIYFRTKHTSINKPLLAQDSTDVLPTANNRDFNCSLLKPKAECKNEYGNAIGFPIQYLTDRHTYISQFIGSKDITFGWDTTQSRFTIGYLGQPSVSTFDIKAGAGGDMAVTCFYPSPAGEDNYNFMDNIRRDGGVNITNWKSNTIDFGQTPDFLRTKYSIPSSYMMDAYHDENNNTKKEWFNDSSLNTDAVGNRFWNKLGFSNNQINTTAVGHSISTPDLNYIPLGTTELKFDSADALLTSSEPAENTPFYQTLGAFGPPPTAAGTAVDIEAGWEYAAIGGLQMNGHNVGYGVGSTAGRPTGFRRNIAAPGKFDVLSSSYNPDRQEFNAFTLQSDTTTLNAENLPIKSEFGYYYMVSDIVDTDFFISNKYGSSENIIGVLSKLNVGGDYIFQYQAPQTFYVKKDRVLQSIKTTILTPKLRIPVALDPFSSVIYQITRYEPQPDVVQAMPLWMRQEQKWGQIMNFINSMATQLHPKTKTQAQRIQEIISEVANVVTQPLDNQSVLQERILGNYQQLGLGKFKNDRVGMRNFLLNNPSAQHFLNDLSLYSHNSNNTNSQVTDAESITPDNLLNTLLTQQGATPANDIGTEPPDLQTIADNVNDNIQTYQGISNAPVEDLITENYGIAPRMEQMLSDDFDPKDPEGFNREAPYKRNIGDKRKISGDKRRLLAEKRKEASAYSKTRNRADAKYVKENVGNPDSDYEKYLNEQKMKEADKKAELKDKIDEELEKK